ncbi:MAG: hypothetical protein EZS28_044345 [Streblomastix strix]|uniref:Uncharacterized protein n=1 Tax=Streblomastix strix TaxID=222440 RepID=A0A5J4TPD7_9EUKA|nr:MAG: hypothetical protein EZS28_044345 [Streblomastix strix]
MEEFFTQHRIDQIRFHAVAADYFLHGVHFEESYNEMSITYGVVRVLELPILDQFIVQQVMTAIAFVQKLFFLFLHAIFQLFVTLLLLSFSPRHQAQYSSNIVTFLNQPYFFPLI